MLPMRKASILALLALLPVAAWSQQLGDGTPIHGDDQQRLAQFDAAVGDALLQAFAAGDPLDVATLADTLQGQALPADQAQGMIAGDWTCRTIKVGGLLPLTVYQPFRCRIGEDGSLEKLTGSQRTKGMIHRDGDRLVYLGVGFIAGDTPPPYAELPVFDPAASPQRTPEIAVVQMTDRNRGRVMFPAPHLESRFDILTLSR